MPRDCSGADLHRPAAERNRSGKRRNRRRGGCWSQVRACATSGRCETAPLKWPRSLAGRPASRNDLSCPLFNPGSGTSHRQTEWSDRRPNYILLHRGPRRDSNTPKSTAPNNSISLVNLSSRGSRTIRVVALSALPAGVAIPNWAATATITPPSSVACLARHARLISAKQISADAEGEKTVADQVSTNAGKPRAYANPQRYRASIRAPLVAARKS